MPTWPTSNAWPSQRNWPTGNSWPYAAGSAPALFLAGQSNAGNPDGTAGTIDGRVTLTWNGNGAGVIGPGAMGLQSGGHSFEMQASANMAASFNSNIIVGKDWWDGTQIGQWLPGQPSLWPNLAITLESFANQCVAAGVTQVEFGWCQGESNTPNDQSGTLATFQQYTSDVFDSVRDLLAGFGITTHFTIIKTNSGLTTGPNPGDVSAASLAAIRGYQDALAIARTDTSTIDPPAQAAIHYISGATNTIGATWAVAIASRYTGAQPAFATPPTVETILGSAIQLHLDSRAITGLVDNDPISSWPDLGPGAHPGAQSGSARPLYKTAAFTAPSGVVHPAARFDGVDDKMPITGLSLVAPATTPILSFWVGKQNTFTFGDRIWGGNANFCGCYQGDVSGQITATNASSAVAQFGEPVGSFGKIENFFSNNAGDYQRLIDALATTGNLGNTAPGAVSLGSANGGSFSDQDCLMWLIVSRQITKSERDKLRGFGAKNYGLAVWGTQ